MFHQQLWVPNEGTFNIKTTERNGESSPIYIQIQIPQCPPSPPREHPALRRRMHFVVVPCTEYRDQSKVGCYFKRAHALVLQMLPTRDISGISLHMKHILLVHKVFPSSLFHLHMYVDTSTCHLYAFHTKLEFQEAKFAIKNSLAV